MRIVERSCFFLEANPGRIHWTRTPNLRGRTEQARVKVKREIPEADGTPRRQTVTLRHHKCRSVFPYDFVKSCRMLCNKHEPIPIVTAKGKELVLLHSKVFEIARAEILVCLVYVYIAVIDRRAREQAFIKSINAWNTVRYVGYNFPSIFQAVKHTLNRKVSFPRPRSGIKNSYWRRQPHSLHPFMLLRRPGTSRRHQLGEQSLQRSDGR